MSDLKITYKQEVLRKLIHLSSLWIPLGAYFSSPEKFLPLLYVTSFITVLFDVLRHYNKTISKIFNLFFAPLLRPHEQVELMLTGSSYMMIAASCCFLAFPRDIAIFAMSVLIISDSAAALVGKKFGNIKILDKSLEGLLAFIVSGLLVALYIWLNFDLELHWLLNGFASVIIAGIVELISSKIKIDDNLTVPLAIAFSMHVFNYICNITW
jgi:dolichol kinase